MEHDFNEVIRTIQKDDPRYKKGAYYFVRQGLDHTLRKLHKSGALKDSKHISGQQLADGIREFALEQFGPMARTVLNHWGIGQSSDFGAIVFHLVECKVLGKTENDKPEDFDNLFDFEEAFDAPFRPSRLPDLALNAPGSRVGSIEKN